MDENYTSLLERISKSSGEDVEEIGRKIEAKRAKLSGLISKEGAAQIVAAELGVSFENERMKISELVQGMRKANFIGKVTRLFEVREYSKNGKEGKIGSFLFGDETSNVRVVLWDVNHIALIEKKDIKEGDVLEIANGSVRNGEVHLSGFSDIKHSKEKLEGVKTELVVSSGKLSDAKQGVGMKVRAVIVQSFEPKFFESKQDGEKRALLNIVLDDGTENIRAVLFAEQINKLGLTDEEINSPEKFKEKKEELLGSEKVFSGNFKINSFFNQLEMSINNVEEVNVDELVKELESKAL